MSTITDQPVARPYRSKLCNANALVALSFWSFEGANAFYSSLLRTTLAIHTPPRPYYAEGGRVWLVLHVSYSAHGADATDIRRRLERSLETTCIDGRIEKKVSAFSTPLREQI
jgi:hypothetical protein